MQINYLDFHENRQYNSRSVVPSLPTPNFNVEKSRHEESEDVSTTWNQEGRTFYYYCDVYDLFFVYLIFVQDCVFELRQLTINLGIII